MSDRVVLSMKEVSHRLGVSQAFLYDEINRGKLVTVKLSKRRLVHVDDLNAYIAANRQAPKAA